MPQLLLSHGRVHYLDQGEGPPVLFLHANPGDARDFVAVMPALASSYRVLALDWPGYGGSELPSLAATRTAWFFYDILREFVHALDLPPLAVIGNSLGGNAAARLAIEQPARVRALVLVSPGGFTAHNALTRAFCRWMGSSWGLSPKVWAAWYLRRRTPETQAMLARAQGEQSRAPVVALNRAVWRSFAQPEHDLRAFAAAIQAPTLLVFGRDDPAIAARRDGRVAAALLPDAQLEIMPCGHAPFAEMPQLFLDTLLPFLQRYERMQPVQAAKDSGPGLRRVAV